MRILCLSNMYPSPAEPDYGAFVATMCDAIESLGHEVVRVAIDTRRHGPMTTPRKYLSLARQAVPAARTVDVIYGHYLFPTGAVAALAGRIAGRPWVLTAHGGDVRHLASAGVARMAGPGIANASAIVAVSRHVAAELRASGLRLPAVNVINMGVDTTRFTPRERADARRALDQPVDVPIVLAVGGLTDRKNPLRLLQAFEVVRLRHPRARLVYVGDGPLANALRTGIARAGLEGSVVMTGALPGARVADWMAACDVLALPSIVEPLGVVALEALASGRPVVATANGGTAEVVGRGGTLVDPMDPRSIAAGIDAMLTAPPSIDRCREAALAHDVTRQARRVIDVLRTATAV